MGLSQDPHAERFCPVSGKPMLTKSRAKSTAKRMLRRKKCRGNLEAYLCRACDTWHVGNRRRFTGPKPS